MQTLLLVFLMSCLSSGHSQTGCEKSSLRAPPNVDLSDLNSSYRDDEVVSLRCDVGHVGSLRATCINGEWSIRGRRCQEKPCGSPEEIAHGNFHLVKGEDFVFGAVVEYTCNNGSRMVGKTNQRTCVDSGWDNDVPVCEAKSCGLAGEIPNGKYNYDEGVEFGSKVTAVCNEGYYLIGANIRLCTSTGWDGREAVCEPVQCPPPPHVPGAQLSGSVDEPHLYSHVISYRCPEGYLVGEREIHCTKNGNWSAPPPRCTVSQRVCPQDFKFKSQKLVQRVGPWPTSAGQTVTVSCPEGQQLNSSTTTITCNDNGEWSPYWPKCQAVKCPDLKVSNGIVSTKRVRAGANVTVTCSRGYVLDTPGSGALTCLSNGSWNQSEPTCNLGCSRPRVSAKLQLRERYVLQETFRLGDSVSYSCGVGYTRSGGSSISQCTLTGWTPTTLRCEPKSCGSAGEIPNGKYNYDEGVEFGSKVTAVCNEGYHLIGANIRLCTSTGWDGREAVCERA